MSALDKYKHQLLADKKKLSVVISLAAIMLLLWGRLLLKQDPRTATASPATASIASTSAGQPDPATAAAEKLAATVLPRPVVKIAMADKPARDVFRLNKSQYSPTAGGSSPTDEGKSPPQIPDDKLRIDAIREMAAKLRFQAAMLGPTPRALINERIYQRGDKINGFRISVIESRRIVLEKDGIEIHLEMSE